MKIVNRSVERLAETSNSVIAQDEPNDHVHVVICPGSGDVEVWDGERLEFKAYCDKSTRRSTAVGLSGYFRQKERGNPWQRVVKRCKRLDHARAFHEVYHFALDIGKALEERDQTCAPRSLALDALQEEAFCEYRREVRLGIHKPMTFSKRAMGDALPKGQMPPWSAKVHVVVSDIRWN